MSLGSSLAQCVHAMVAVESLVGLVVEVRWVVEILSLSLAHSVT